MATSVAGMVPSTWAAASALISLPLSWRLQPFNHWLCVFTGWKAHAPCGSAPRSHASLRQPHMPPVNQTPESSSLILPEVTECPSVRLR